MPSYTLNLFGLELSFKTDAENDRIEAAQKYLERKYGELTVAAGDMSKEKVLTFMLLSLADDYLVNKSKLAQLEERIGEILEKVD